MIIESGRTKKDYPTVEMNVTDWRLTTVLKDVNVILNRFGTSYTDQTLQLRWYEQSRPHSIDWNDIISIHIPYRRDGFRFDLTKIAEKTSKRKPECNDGSARERQKTRKSQRNKRKQRKRQQAMDKLKTNIELKCFHWINDRTDDDEFW